LKKPLSFKPRQQDIKTPSWEGYAGLSIFRFSPMPYALCIFATDHGQLTTDDIQPNSGRKTFLPLARHRCDAKSIRFFFPGAHFFVRPAYAGGVLTAEITEIIGDTERIISNLRKNGPICLSETVSICEC
jgi:hypothetical protein